MTPSCCCDCRNKYRSHINVKAKRLTLWVIFENHGNVHVQKISTPPRQRLEFTGGGGGSVRPKKCKEMCEALWEFLEGWDRGRSLLWGRYGFFLGLHILSNLHKPSLIALDKLSHNKSKSIQHMKYYKSLGITLHCSRNVSDKFSLLSQ